MLLTIPICHHHHRRHHHHRLPDYGTNICVVIKSTFNPIEYIRRIVLALLLLIGIGLGGLYYFFYVRKGGKKVDDFENKLVLKVDDERCFFLKKKCKIKQLHRAAVCCWDLSNWCLLHHCKHLWNW